MAMIGAVAAALVLSQTLEVVDPGPGDIVPPRLRHLPSPDRFYPPASIAAREQGRTVLRCRLVVEGRLKDCVLHESSGFPALDAAALSMAALALYSPLTQNGLPRESVALLPVSWRLGD